MEGRESGTSYVDITEERSEGEKKEHCESNSQERHGSSTGIWGIAKRHVRVNTHGSF